MAKQGVSTVRAPKAIGPYSQAISSNGLIFCSGQIALDPVSGELQSGSVADETRVCMQNLTAVLDAAGATWADVLKVNVYLTDFDQYAVFNEVYAEFFDEEPPARAAIGVAALPKGAQVEVDCIARV
ncbi:MAG: RidA family protein [Actinobacteria bacterium]|jgi:2-iminobutanoate/2-iminopropanoate deaminase|nr:RidA family protein [Actinomycetota bacterium]